MKIVLGAVLEFDSYEDLIVACQEVIDENKEKCIENGGMPEGDYNDPQVWVNNNAMEEFLKYNGTLLYNHVDGDYDEIFNDSIKESRVIIED